MARSFAREYLLSLIMGELALSLEALELVSFTIIIPSCGYHAIKFSLFVGDSATKSVAIKNISSDPVQVLYCGFFTNIPVLSNNCDPTSSFPFPYSCIPLS